MMDEQKDASYCIVSDIDDTLLPAGSNRLSEKARAAISLMLEKNILFVIASGRPFDNLWHLMEENAGRVVYICENGTLVREGEKTLLTETLEESLACQILRDIEEHETECEILVNGTDHCYIHPRTEAFRAYIQDERHYPAVIVEDLCHVPEPYLQLSVHHPLSIEVPGKRLISRWENRTQAVISGQKWMDITKKNVNKGSALSKFLKKRQIPVSHCAAFGDSFNDMSMFGKAGFSYAMAWSDEEVKKSARFVTDDPVKAMMDLAERIGR